MQPTPRSAPHQQVSKEWIDKTRQVLLKIETDTFFARANKWKELINEQTISLQMDLFGRHISKMQFQCIMTRKDLRESTAYLNSWPGLDLNNCDRTNMPSTLQHYQAKAKNWLNGRRAKQCSNTLFPLLIVKAEEV